MKETAYRKAAPRSCRHRTHPGGTLQPSLQILVTNLWMYHLKIKELNVMLTLSVNFLAGTSLIRV